MAIFDSRKYAVTLKLIFLKAVYEIFPDIEVEIEHSLNNGTYGTVTKGEKITEEGIKKIDKKMKEIIEKGYPITLVCRDNETLKGKSSSIPRKDINMPAHLENSALATGREKVGFQSNLKERQCQEMFKLLHNCTHFTH